MVLEFIEVDGEERVRYDGPLEGWWLVAGDKCGWVATRNLRITAACPVLRRFVGWDKPKCPTAWVWEKLSDETEESLALLDSGARTLRR